VVDLVKDLFPNANLIHFRVSRRWRFWK